jgi:hypothetical protein
MTDINQIVETATNVKTFSVLEAIQGTAFPTDEVTIYTDAASAYEISVLETRISEERDTDKANELSAQQAVLRDKIKASALTFTLHGFAPEIVHAINDSVAAKHNVEDTDTGPAAREANFRYLAESIQRIVSADGSVDSHHWTFEEIEALEKAIPSEEFGRLMVKMEEVAFAALVFEAKVDADF